MTLIAKAPKTFTLTGKSFACYQAGMKMGANSAYSVASDNLRKVKHQQALQLVELSKQLLEDPTYPIPDDHPLKVAIEALPTLAEGLEGIAMQFDVEAGKQQVEGSQIMGQVAAQDTADEARWRPPLRAWLLLAAAMTVSTTGATLAVLAVHGGW